MNNVIKEAGSFYLTFFADNQQGDLHNFYNMIENNQNKITIGAVLFKSTITSLLPLPTKIQEQINNSLYWHLYSHKYINQKWNQIISHIQEINVEEMQLSDNDYEPIIKQIAPISFPNLTSLSLISNNILSIESLCSSKMPNLLYLHISRNKIIKLSPLKKTFWPKLTRLIINDNPLIDSNEIMSQCYFPMLQLIILQGWLDSLVFAPDISFIAKLETLNLKYINVNSEFRIIRTDFTKHFNQKYRELKVNIHC